MFRIEKGMYRANIPRTVRFPEALFEYLSQLAQENDISFNFLVLQCCNYALENLKKKEEIEEDGNQMQKTGEKPAGFFVEL